MNAFPFENLIAIDNRCPKPKYHQIANAIINAINRRKLQAGDKLPSVHHLSTMLSVSNDTVVKGYAKLKQMGLIDSTHGKGCYVSSNDTGCKTKLLVLTPTLDPYLYDSFVQPLTNRFLVDLKVYHNKTDTFRRLVQNNIGKYDYYLLWLSDTLPQAGVSVCMNQLPPEKTILLVDRENDLVGHHGAVLKGTVSGIFTVLEEALPHLRKYSRLRVINAKDGKRSAGSALMQGIHQFCAHYEFSYKVVNDIQTKEITSGTVYLALTDEAFVALVQKLMCSDLELGKQIGIISFKETVWNRLVLGGITTISINYQLLAEKVKQFIVTKTAMQCQVEFRLTLRGSI